MPAGYFESPIDTGLPDIPVSNIPPELWGEFYKVYQAIKALQEGLNLYAGIVSRDELSWSLLTPLDTILSQNLNRLYVEATETINFGAMVNLYDSGGALKARNANSTNNTKPCHAFCNTVGGMTNGNFGEVVVGNGLCTGVSGMVRGTRYFLSTTNGVITNVAPSTAGNIVQPVGIALAPTFLYFSPTFHWTQL